MVFVLSEVIEDTVEFLTSRNHDFFTKNNVCLLVENKVVVAAYSERTSGDGLKY